MKGTDAQKTLARQMGVQDWSPEELAEAARGFTLPEYQTGRALDALDKGIYDRPELAAVGPLYADRERNVKLIRDTYRDSNAAPTFAANC